MPAQVSVSLTTNSSHFLSVLLPLSINFSAVLVYDTTCHVIMYSHVYSCIHYLCRKMIFLLSLFTFTADLLPFLPLLSLLYSIE